MLFVHAHENAMDVLYDLDTGPKDASNKTKKFLDLLPGACGPLNMQGSVSAIQPIELLSA